MSTLAKLTLTEALAELKTIDKRIVTKQNNILTYAARQDLIKDPLEKDGGSVKFVKEEKQGMNDLETRKVAIRRAIAKQMILRKFLSLPQRAPFIKRHLLNG